MFLQPRSSFSGPSRTIAESSSSKGKPKDEISSILSKFKSRKDKQIIQLDEEIDLDRNLELYNTNQLDVLNPRMLYQTGITNINTTLIRSIREEEIRVINNSITVDILSPETILKLKRTGKRFFHLGLIIIGIKVLTRKGTGTKLLTLVLDQSWTANIEKALLSGMEIDLNDKAALVYCVPDILKSIKDLKNLKLGFSTAGFDDYIGNNLIISIGILGKASNRSGMKFKINLAGIVQNISSKGIKMIEPRRFDPTI